MYVSRYMKENPDCVLIIKYASGKFWIRVELNGICLFDADHEKIYVATGIIENQIRPLYEKQRDNGDVNDLLNELNAIVRHSSQGAFAKELSKVCFSEMSFVSTRHKPTFDDLSGASHRISEFVLQHIRSSMLEKSIMDKTIDDLCDENEELKRKLLAYAPPAA